ncbi:MAG: hypothetical protein ACP5HK_07190 [Acidilobus sp.]
MGRSISNMVAVIMLILVAASVVVVIFLWVTGIIWRLGRPSALSEVLDVINANVTSGVSVTGTGEEGTIIVVTVYNPAGSVSTDVRLIELQAVNGTTLCTIGGLSTAYLYTSTTVSQVTVGGGQTVTVAGACPGVVLPAGLDVRVVVITSSGVEAAKGAIVSG